MGSIGSRGVCNKTKNASAAVQMLALLERLPPAPLAMAALPGALAALLHAAPAAGAPLAARALHAAARLAAALCQSERSGSPRCTVPEPVLAARQSSRADASGGFSVRRGRRGQPHGGGRSRMWLLTKGTNPGGGPGLNPVEQSQLLGELGELRRALFTLPGFQVGCTLSCSIDT